MVAVPALPPVTCPVVELIAAVEGLLLLQIPPPAPLVSVMELPLHTVPDPDIAVGVVFAVMVLVAMHPVEGVKVIVATPAELPVTTPLAAPTPAVGVELLLQVPVPELAVNVMLLPTHTPAGPPIVGAAFTVIILVTAQLPTE